MTDYLINLVMVLKFLYLNITFIIANRAYVLSYSNVLKGV